MTETVEKRRPSRGYVGVHRLTVLRNSDRFASAVWYRWTSGRFAAKKRGIDAA